MNHGKEIKKLWSDFKKEQSNLFQKAGFPLDYHKNQNVFIDFLSHGYLDHHNDIHKFTVSQMNEIEYNSFKELVLKYFQSNFDYFPPIAFRSQNEIKELESLLN